MSRKNRFENLDQRAAATSSWARVRGPPCSVLPTLGGVSLTMPVEPMTVLVTFASDTPPPRPDLPVATFLTNELLEMRTSVPS